MKSPTSNEIQIAFCINLHYNNIRVLVCANSRDTGQQVLLVFPKNDTVCCLLQEACDRLEMNTFSSCTINEAVESFQNMTDGAHNLIIVDGRQPQIFDPETVAR